MIDVDELSIKQVSISLGCVTPACQNGGRGAAMRGRCACMMGGGAVRLGGAYVAGVGHVCLVGMYAGAMHAPTPCGQNEVPVKRLPSRNFIGGR